MFWRANERRLTWLLACLHSFSRDIIPTESLRLQASKDADSREDVVGALVLAHQPP